MNKRNEKILLKAIGLIDKGQFDREWESLFEHSSEQSNNLVCNLYFAAKKSEVLRNNIFKHRDYIPVMLYRSLFAWQ